MDWKSALEIVVAKTGVERYRLLTSDTSPFPDKVATYRRLMIEKASEAKDVQSYPPVAQMAQNAAQALLGAARDGFRTVDQAERDRRLAVCAACPEYDADRGRCRACGCWTRAKAGLASSRCPKSLW